MKVSPTKLEGVMLVEPAVFGDERGFFMETYNLPRYEQAGIRRTFVQDNVSYSSKGTLRGLHFQQPHPQAKLVSVLQGEVFDVAVDIRIGSPNFGKWVGVTLSSEAKNQLYIPEGFAHGFYAIRDSLLFYKCSNVYHLESELTVIWNDAEIAIEWPVEFSKISSKDLRGKLLSEIGRDRLPVY